MSDIVVAILSLSILIILFVVYNRKIKNARQFFLQTSDDYSSISEETDDNKAKSGINAIELDYSKINRAYRIADMHFSRGDFQEAEKWLIKVLALHDSHAESLNKLGVIYIQQGNYQKAKIIFRKLLSVTQKEPAYYCNYGRCLYNLGCLNDALEAYENAIKLDSSKPSRFISIGQIYYEQKKIEKAMVYFDKALNLDPQNLEYLKLISEIAELTGDEKRLHESLKKITEINPYNEIARTKLAKLENLTTPTDLPAQ